MIMEILVARHLRKVVPRLYILLSTRKKSSIVKQAYLKSMSKKESKRVYTSTIVVSHDPLSPSSTSSAVKTPENAEEDPNDPEPADRDIQM